MAIGFPGRAGLLSQPEPSIGWQLRSVCQTTVWQELLTAAQAVTSLCSPHLFPSIQFDMNSLSRKHSSGTVRRLIRLSFSAKATCLDVGSRSMSDTGFSRACASIQTLKDHWSC